MRLLKILVVAFVLCSTLGWATWKTAKSRSFQSFGELISHVESKQPLIALTFDDGPHPNAVPQILAILQQHNVRATFFVTGAELERNPELGAALVADGHELGNHSYSHKRMVFRSHSFIASEIQRTDELIRRAGHIGKINFRPPYGAKGFALPYYLAESDRQTIMWNIEPESDSTIASSSEAIASHVIENATPGSIILLHVMYESRRTSLASVQHIIEGLHRKGYRFVTVSELLAAASHDK